MLRSWIRYKKSLQQRAEHLKRKFNQKDEEDDNKTDKREKWMLELPEDRADKFGLGPRKFKKRASGDKSNRSLWTETPNSSGKSKGEEPPPPEDDEYELELLSRHDKMMDEMVKKVDGRRSKKSLLQLHQDKLKTDKESKAEEKTERRPFDRNIDLQANRFDEAQKKSILKKAQLLDTRFSQGKSKYL